MVEFLDRASAWPKRLIDTAVLAHVPVSVAITLPGFLAAVNNGRYGESVAHLLPIFRGSQPHEDA